MITIILILGALVIVDQILGVLDLTSTVERKLIKNFVVVWLGTLLGYWEFKIMFYVLKNPSFDENYLAISMVMSTIAATASIAVITVNRIFKVWNRKRKLRKNMAKAREKRWVDYGYYDEVINNIKTLTSGEMK